MSPLGVHPPLPIHAQTWSLNTPTQEPVDVAHSDTTNLSHLWALHLRSLAQTPIQTKV